MAPSGIILSQASPGNTVSGRLPVLTKLLFSTGDLSTSLPLAIQMFFQLYFLTDIVRLDPSMVGWMIAIIRCWDALNDPLVGVLSDRIQSRLGRRGVLLITGSIPLGLFFALSWLIPPWSDTALAVYFTLMIMAFDTAYTVVHVGYNALTPMMTFDYDERSSLNGYRMVFSLGGTLVAILFATLVAEFDVTGAERFALIGIVLGIAACIPPWIVFGVTRAADQGQLPSKVSFGGALWMTLRNRAFVMLMGLYLTSWTATSVLAAMLVYYANYYLKVPDQANYFVLIAESSAIVFIPAIVLLARRWDKPRAFMVGIAVWCIILLGLFVLPANAIAGAYLLAFACGPGIATALVIPWAMVPDVIESEQVDTGDRREGAYYSFMAFFQKLGTGAAMWAIGQMLALSGYVTPATDHEFPDQPNSAVAMIRWIIGPLTLGLLLISLPFAHFYPLRRQRHAENLGRLRNRDSK